MWSFSTCPFSQTAKEKTTWSNSLEFRDIQHEFMKMKTEKYRPLKISVSKTRRNVENMKTSPNSLTKAGWVDALRFCLQTDDIHSILKRRGGNGQKRKGKRERWKNGWLGMEEKTQRESEKRERTMKRHCEWGKERRRESARAQRKSDTWLADGQNKPVCLTDFFNFYPQHFDFLMILRFTGFYCESEFLCILKPQVQARGNF